MRLNSQICEGCVYHRFWCPLGQDKLSSTAEANQDKVCNFFVSGSFSQPRTSENLRIPVDNTARQSPSNRLRTSLSIRSIDHARRYDLELVQRAPVYRMQCNARQFEALSS